MNREEVVDKINSIYENLEVINSSWKYRVVYPFLITIGIFLGAFIPSFIYGYRTKPPETTDPLAVSMASGLEYTTLEIIANNLFVGAFLSVAGALILPFAVIMIQNGYVVGKGLGLLTNEYGPLAFVFITPHGFLEIPALILAGMAGLRLTPLVIAYCTFNGTHEEMQDSEYYKQTYQNVKSQTLRDYKYLFTASMILFILGAIVETTITIELIYRIV